MKFKRDTVTPTCDCRERASLCAMVDAFAAEMRAQLLAKLDEGYSGWDSEDWPVDGEDGIMDRLRAHIPKGDPVDVANFACFWWNRLSPAD